MSVGDLNQANRMHPKESYLEEMLWSDPAEDLQGTSDSPRGAGKLFGNDVSERILKLLKVKILIRGHQPYDEGYKVSHNGKILTIFSTNKPPYRNKHGAYLKINLSEKFENAEQLASRIVKLN